MLWQSLPGCPYGRTAAAIEPDSVTREGTAGDEVRVSWQTCNAGCRDVVIEAVEGTLAEALTPELTLPLVAPVRGCRSLALVGRGRRDASPCRWRYRCNPPAVGRRCS